MTATPFADAAPALAAQGFQVFRIKPGCKVGGARWRHGPASEVATADPDEVARRARRYPTSNIGIATGQLADGTYFAVLDVDTDAGGVRPEWAVPTLEAHTPSGGSHLYYVTNGRVSTSAGQIALGVDVRGDGGMVVAPPSRTGAGAYEWATPIKTPMAFMPVWRFHEYSTTRAGADGRPIGRTRKRPEDVGYGERHYQALLWAAWFASQGCSPEEVAELTWQLVSRFQDPVPRGEANIAAVIKWACHRQADQRADMDAEDAYIRQQGWAAA